jgi:hypothetical protein
MTLDMLTPAMEMLLYFPILKPDSIGGSTIFPGPFFPLLAALRSQISDPTPFPRFSDRHHCGVILCELLMLLCGLHHSRIGVGLLCICLCLPKTGHHFLMTGIYHGPHFLFHRSIHSLQYMSSWRIA